MFEKEAEEYFKGICGDYNEEFERTNKRHYWVGFDIKNAYKQGATDEYRKAEELINDLTAAFNREHAKARDLRLEKPLCLFNSFKELDFKTASNKALQAIHLVEKLYVVRSESCGKYQYTLLEADSEEEAIRRCM